MQRINQNRPELQLPWEDQEEEAPLEVEEPNKPEPKMLVTMSGNHLITLSQNKKNKSILKKATDRLYNDHNRRTLNRQEQVLQSAREELAHLKLQPKAQ